MARLRSVDKLISDFARKKPVRAGSLIITVFGDSISQHGNCVWLGSLINALEPFGLNARQIRTAVFRLVKEDWLSAEQQGRRSFYSFTDFGLRHYLKAARRIYAATRPSWDGKWTLVLPAFVENHQREVLRRELRWLGFGPLTPGLLAHPNADRASLDETLKELAVADKVVVTRGETEALTSREVLRQLARECWQLDALESRYREFISKFRPVLNAAKKSRALEPAQCFQVRTLLIHEYRRILLQDTDLPEDLLPGNWPGYAAATLTADLYGLIHKPAMCYLVANMEAVTGPLPGAGRAYYARLGGLS